MPGPCEASGMLAEAAAWLHLEYSIDSISFLWSDAAVGTGDRCCRGGPGVGPSL